MPAVLPGSSESPSKVLVTGASGYLAIHVVQALLHHGFSVRGTVRSTTKGDYLTKLLNDKKFEYVIVPNIEAPDAFDEAVKGVQAIAHTASPVSFPEGDPQEVVIKPAVQGTINALESAKRFGSEVKRIVITSSICSVEWPILANRKLTEDQWNDDSVNAVKQKGADAGGSDIYSASKTLAERAAWDWMEKNKGVVAFDITALCPPYIWGPILTEVKSSTDVNGSMAKLLAVIGSETPKTGDELIQMESIAVDVRDVADHHALAILTPAAGNERLLTGGDTFSWQDVYDSLQEAPAFKGYPVGASPGATRGKKWDSYYNQEKLTKVLGKTSNELFRPLSETVRDSVASLEAKGVLLAKA